MAFLRNFFVTQRFYGQVMAAHSRRLLDLEIRTHRMEKQMAKDRDALAQLDSELDNLEAYVKSDEDNDAAEINARVDRVRSLLASAQGNGDADADKAAEVEEKISDLTAEAQES